VFSKCIFPCYHQISLGRVDPIRYFFCEKDTEIYKCNCSFNFPRGCFIHFSPLECILPRGPRNLRKNPAKKHLSAYLHLLSLCATSKPSEHCCCVSSWSEVSSPGKPACSALLGSYFPSLKMYFNSVEWLEMRYEGEGESMKAALRAIRPGNLVLINE